jgi:hypothetical protein
VEVQVLSTAPKHSDQRFLRLLYSLISFPEFSLRRPQRNGPTIRRPALHEYRMESVIGSKFQLSN